jgi:hypothetical protein
MMPIALTGHLPEAEMNLISGSAHKHQTARRKKSPPMLNSTRLWLERLYRPYNLELAAMLQDSRFTWDDQFHLLGHESDRI